MMNIFMKNIVVKVDVKMNWMHRGEEVRKIHNVFVSKIDSPKIIAQCCRSSLISGAL